LLFTELNHVFPQQEPGPAQLEASPGRLPQQPVSFGPGKRLCDEPVRDEVCDISLVKSFEPHAGQVTSALFEKTSTSLTSPQLSHLNS
jgi:hypothetical protein